MREESDERQVDVSNVDSSVDLSEESERARQEELRLETMNDRHVIEIMSKSKHSAVPRFGSSKGPSPAVRTPAGSNKATSTVSSNRQPFNYAQLQQCERRSDLHGADEILPSYEEVNILKKLDNVSAQHTMHYQHIMQ